MARVLVVENDPHDLLAIRTALEEPSTQVQSGLSQRGLSLPSLAADDIVEARSKQAALNALSSEDEYDLILLDLHIPDYDGAEDPEATVLHGFDILKEARRQRRHTPVVILSANLSISQRGSGGEPGNAHGLRMIRDLLASRRAGTAEADWLPDDFLIKTESAEVEVPAISYIQDIPALQRKLATYFVDLTEDEVRSLSTSHFVPKSNTGTRRVLRMLKRIARSVDRGKPLPDVLLLGRNGVGKTTFAKSYHALRLPVETGKPRLGFYHEDLGSLDTAGSAPSLRLFGGSAFNPFAGDAWSLGAFSRATLYHDVRTRRLRVIPSQHVDTWEGGDKPGDFHPPDMYPGEPTRQNYPRSTDAVDFDGSGTLFLDEVVNIDKDIQRMLLQALGYDRGNRSIITTGQVHIPLHVGPALVLATRKNIAKEINSYGRDRDVEDPDESTEAWMKDYLLRIDQVRVTIPPLKERRDEIVPILTRLVENRIGKQVPVDPRTEQVLLEDLQFDNNVADLVRIADRVRPEEESISFHHIRPLFEREFPIRRSVALPEVEASLKTCHWDEKACEQYFKLLEEGKVSPMTLSEVRDTYDLSLTSSYRVGLYLMKRENCYKDPIHWPTDKSCLDATGKKSSAFQTSMVRLCKTKPTNLEVVIEDLKDWLKV